MTGKASFIVCLILYSMHASAAAAGGDREAAHLHKGQEDRFASKGDYQKAAEEFSPALSLDRAAFNGSERVRMALAQSRSEKQDNAMDDGDKAMTRGDYDAAARSYRAETQTHPESYEAKFKLARALSFSKHRDEAIRLYTELLATRPSNSDLLLARGRAYAWENRWKEAEADLTTVTVRSPDYGDAWSALGDVYLWSDRPRDAVNAYGKWVAANPDDSRAYIARAKAHRSAGDLDAARADFEEARAHGAPGPEIDQYLASLQRRRSEPEASASGSYKWSASLSYGYSEISPVRDYWHDYSATIRHYWQPGSLGLEYLGSRRFDSNDYALALDAYADLWPRAYANFRYQYSPKAVLFPDDSYRTELFQGMERAGSFPAATIT